MLKINVLFFTVALSLASASAQATPHAGKANNYGVEKLTKFTKTV